MADSTGTSQDAETPKKKTLLRIVALLLLCVVALAGGFVASVGPQGAMKLVGLADDPEDEAATSGEDAAEDHAAGDGHGAAPATPATPAGLPGEHIVVTPFQEIIVNITATTATGRQTTRFLKLNLALAYDNRVSGAENIESRKLFLRDSFQEYLRQLNENDLQGSIGLVRLKSELLRRARAISDSDAPQEFLIADLIVQ
ncbi:flagellar basal body-associated FliL family protein [Salipiger bermudensis]|uniref:flagellar basal body-associated FliL family protein n=1 Tax=Salipiger bermudensis TaxID=344736 RepID=UPI001CD4D588|nr:flagellar basal body-associated FliL family protein [Salipiger bermudensis]MCA1287750.1 flagellar basal body-associated FliL family protein [Salipiger bermudensis]